MKHGFLAGVACTLLVMGLVSTAGATSGKVQKEIEYRNIQVSLDGKVLDLRDAKGNTVEPFMFGGTNYIPARALAESLGLNVAWDGATSTVVLTHPAETAPAETVVVPTETPATTTQQTSTEEQQLYRTKSGKHYHADPNCNGGTYIPTTLSEALSLGLTPCDKCIG